MDTRYNYYTNNIIAENDFKTFIRSTLSEEEINIKTFRIMNHEKTLAEFSIEPYTFNEKQLMFSLTKSITSIGIGIAIDKGYLNLGDRIIDFFHVELQKKFLRIFHLLRLKIY